MESRFILAAMHTRLFFLLSGALLSACASGTTRPTLGSSTQQPSTDAGTTAPVLAPIQVTTGLPSNTTARFAIQTSIVVEFLKRYTPQGGVLPDDMLSFERSVHLPAGTLQGGWVPETFGFDATRAVQCAVEMVNDPALRNTVDAINSLLAPIAHSEELEQKVDVVQQVNSLLSQLTPRWVRVRIVLPATKPELLVSIVRTIAQDGNSESVEKIPGLDAIVWHSSGRQATTVAHTADSVVVDYWLHLFANTGTAQASPAQLQTEHSAAQQEILTALRGTTWTDRGIDLADTLLRVEGQTDDVALLADITGLGETLSFSTAVADADPSIDPGRLPVLRAVGAHESSHAFRVASLPSHAGQIPRFALWARGSVTDPHFGLSFDAGDTVTDLPGATAPSPSVTFPAAFENIVQFNASTSLVKAFPLLNEDPTSLQGSTSLAEAMRLGGAGTYLLLPHTVFTFVRGMIDGFGETPWSASIAGKAFARGGIVLGDKGELDWALLNENMTAADAACLLATPEVPCASVRLRVGAIVHHHEQFMKLVQVGRRLVLLSSSARETLAARPTLTPQPVDALAGGVAPISKLGTGVIQMLLGPWTDVLDRSFAITTRVEGRSVSFLLDPK